MGIKARGLSPMPAREPTEEAMDELANPSNASNQMFLFFLSVGWCVVAYATADVYVFIRIKMGSWPPSLDYDRLSQEASQASTRADSSPTSMSAAGERRRPADSR